MVLKARVTALLRSVDVVTRGLFPSLAGRPDDDEQLHTIEPDIIGDLHAVLERAAFGQLRHGTGGWPVDPTLGAVAGAMASGDRLPGHNIAAFAWPLLLEAGGLTRPYYGVWRLTSAGREAFAGPTYAHVRALWEAWLTDGVDEFARIEAIEGQHRPRRLTPPDQRRAVVADAMRTLLTDGAWTTVDELFVGMRELGLSPTVARGPRALRRLYVQSPANHLGLLADRPEGADQLWSLLEGRYTLVVLVEYAATLGLLDLRLGPPEGARNDFRSIWGTGGLDYLTRYDGLQAVRLTDLGRYVLGLTDSYQPSAERRSIA